MIHLNDMAWGELLEFINHPESAVISVSKRANGTLVIDCGVNTNGGISAGLAMARIGMAGLGVACVQQKLMDGIPWLYVETQTDNPFLATLLCQAANWPIDIQNFRGMGSGPACLLNRDSSPSQVEKDESDHAVLILEAGNLPDDHVCSILAKNCGVEPGNLAVMVAPTSSLAGSVQIAARSVETALHKLHQIGFDCEKTVSGTGLCPVSMPTGNDLSAMGKTNDAVLFGSQVWLMVNNVGDEEISAIICKIPSSTSKNYGESFLQTLKDAGGFYKIDPGLFAPAEITITNASTGRIFHAGNVDAIRLRKALKD